MMGPEQAQNKLGRGVNDALTRRDTKQLKAVIRDETSQIRQFINDWDPFPGSPVDEYDCLVDGVVSALHSGASVSSLAELICSEFAEHFGVPVAPEDAFALSMRIMTWWSSSASRSPHAS